ncbi:hypothetical protein [Rhizobium laguerreae]|uniref:hypothetical protein n=1 Tax=Rhizobium laguerreae TaxID=1076926 RepID=UPI001C91FBCB|nr:hypothetical protein [Rhizobium laguerreae]MBY3169841.1 hypothetical protein [Rhizobium laguerreae]MBY3213896.1 hypothetical protein [Rhizobium laguerreae]MBY3231788.1 hypothetical protein [Rhizobium laguerreae]
MLFDVFAGSRADAPALIHDQTGKVVLDDKACDSNSLRATIANMEAEAVISSNRSRNIVIPPVIYKQRNHIERCFNR